MTRTNCWRLSGSALDVDAGSVLDTWTNLDSG